MSKKQKRPPRERPAEQITAEKLRVLFEQKVAPGPIKGRVRLRMPGDADLKKLADAAEPLYRTLSDDQKRRLHILLRMMMHHGGRHHGGWRHHG